MGEQNFKITPGTWLFIFGSKSSHVYRRNFENQTRTFFLGWESKFLIFWGWGHKIWVLVGVLIVRIGRYIWVTQQPQCPSGVQRLSIYTTEREARVWWDGTDGTGGRWSKVSFNFLHTFWVKRVCIYILIYEIKIVTEIVMSFKIWCQVGGGGETFLIYRR